MSVTAANGFTASGVHCGVKASGDLDLALVATEDGHAVPAAAVFTVNRMTAAPVLTTRAHLDETNGRAASVVLNSGNANAATGSAGLADAEAMSAATAASLGCAANEVLVCSTGLIGIPLPIDTIVGGIPALVERCTADAAGATAAAEAIGTTDTVRKEAVAHAGSAVVGGMAKGAAMLAPNMATMLAVLTTDAEVEPMALQHLLRDAVDGSFNRLSVDGCTSTNDTVIVLASGRAGAVSEGALGGAIDEVCFVLASKMAGDAEGATKVVRVEVVGAESDLEAEQCARKIADSLLVKCSWYGQDAYWGRIASEAGSAGVAFEADRLALRYGGITVAEAGVTTTYDEVALASYMANRNLDIEVDLGIGPGRGWVLTNDLTHAYVDENMGTS